MKQPSRVVLQVALLVLQIADMSAFVEAETKPRSDMLTFDVGRFVQTRYKGSRSDVRPLEAHETANAKKPRAIPVRIFLLPPRLVGPVVAKAARGCWRFLEGALEALSGKGTKVGTGNGLPSYMVWPDPGVALNSRAQPHETMAWETENYAKVAWKIGVLSNGLIDSVVAIPFAEFLYARVVIVAIGLNCLFIGTFELVNPTTLTVLWMAA